MRTWRKLTWKSAVNISDRRRFSTEPFSAVRAAYDDEGHLWPFPKTSFCDGRSTEEEISVIQTTSHTLLKVWIRQ